MSEDLIRQFFDLQAKEIAVRKEEVTLEMRRNEHSHEFATASLAATAQDRQEIRSFHASQTTRRYIFAAFGLVCLGAVLIYLVERGEADLAVEILKGLAYLVVGGLGGYSVRRVREDRRD